MNKISALMLMAAFVALLGIAPAQALVEIENPVDVSGGDSATVSGGVVMVTSDEGSLVEVSAGETVTGLTQDAIHTSGGNYRIFIDLDGTVRSVGFDAVEAEGSGNIIYHASPTSIYAFPDMVGTYGNGIVSGDSAEVYNYGLIDTFDEGYGPYPMSTGDPENPFVEVYGLGGAGIVVGDSSTVINAGMIEAGASGIIAGTGSTVSNLETGAIISDLNGDGGSPVCGIQVGDGSDVTNAGVIDSANAIGIHAGDGMLDGETRLNSIVNEVTGIIDAYLSGIQAGGNYNIDNSGQITAGFGIFAGDNNVITNHGNADRELDEGDGSIEADAVGILLQVDPAAIDAENIELSILANLLSDVDPTLSGNILTNDGFVLGNGAGIVGIANNTIDNYGISAGFITGIGGIEGNEINNYGLIYGEQAAVIVRNNANLVTNEGGIAGMLGVLSDIGNTITNHGEIGILDDFRFGPAGIGIAVFDGNTIDNFGAINNLGAGIFVAPQSPISAAFAGAGEELAGMGLTLPAYLDDYTLAGNTITNAETGTIRVLGSDPGEGGLASYGILIDSRGGYSGELVGGLFGIEYTPSTYWDAINSRNADEDETNDFVIGMDFLNRITNDGLLSSFYEYYDEGLGEWVSDAYSGGGIHAGDFSDVVNNGTIDVTGTGIAGFDGNRIVNNSEIHSDRMEAAGPTCGILVEDQNTIENNGLIVSYTSNGIVAGNGNTIVNHFDGRIFGYDSGIVAGMDNTIHNMAGGSIVAGNMDGNGSMTGISVGNSDDPIVLLAENSYSSVRGVTDEQAILDSISNQVINDGYILGVDTGIAAGSHAEVTNAAQNTETGDGEIHGGRTGIFAESYNIITNYGYIHSDFEPSFSTGIHAGYENLIINHGTIWAETSQGISGDFHNNITNNGVVTAGTAGIYGWEFNRVENTTNGEIHAPTGIEVDHHNDIINSGTIEAVDYGILAGANNTITNSGTITVSAGAGITVDDYDGFTFGESGFDDTANVVTNTGTGTITASIGIQMDGAGVINIDSGTVEGTDGIAIWTDSNGSDLYQFINISTGAQVLGNISENNGSLSASERDVLTFTGSGSGLFEYDISLIEHIRKSGTGTWLLSESSAINTLIADLEEGILQLDGYLTAEDIYIWDGASLAGAGDIWISSSIPESVYNGGNVSPGPASGGIGSLAIHSGTFYNYFCNDAGCVSGNLNIELQDNGGVVDIDTLHVYDAAIFGGEGIDGGTVTALPLTTLPQGRYTFLYSDSLAVNSVPTLLESSALLDFTLGWDDYDMWLDVSMARLADIGGNRNDETIFDVIGGLADEGIPDAEEILGEILQSSNPLNLLGMLSPEQYPNLLDVGMAGFELYRSGLLGRMGNLHMSRAPRTAISADNSNSLASGGPTLSRLPDSLRTAGGWSGWAHVLGLTGDMDSDHGILGFEVDSLGLALGLDNQVNDNLVLGVGGGYTESEVDFKDFGQDTDVDGYHLALYGSYSTNSWYLDGAVTYASNDYDTVRLTPANKATSSTDGSQWSLYLGGGYNLVDDINWYLIPIASAQWAQANIDGFREQGAGPFNLTVKDYDGDSLATTLGLRLGANLATGETRIEPELRLSWAHEFGDTDRYVKARYAMGGPSFTIQGVEPERDSVLIGAGLNAHLTDNFTLFVDYDGEFRSDFQAHMLSGGMRYSF